MRAASAARITISNIIKIIQSAGVSVSAAVIWYGCKTLYMQE